MPCWWAPHRGRFNGIRRLLAVSSWRCRALYRNPVARGLVEEPDRWRWSSYRSYAYGEAGLVRINDWRWWEAEIRNQAG